MSYPVPGRLRYIRYKERDSSYGTMVLMERQFLWNDSSYGTMVPMERQLLWNDSSYGTTVPMESE